MFEVTFNEACKRTVKEDYEWLRIWCDNVNDANLPHVALIGDSITEGYYNAVKAGLDGVARVDYLATSYSINSELYRIIIKSFVEDTDYAAIHFNYGLHDCAIANDVYEKRYGETVEYLASKAPTAISTVTNVLDETLTAERENWKDVVAERNRVVFELAKNQGYVVDDLNAVCAKMEKSDRYFDGVHYEAAGYEKLAKEVIKTIKLLLKK